MKTKSEKNKDDTTRNLKIFDDLSKNKKKLLNQMDEEEKSSGKEKLALHKKTQDLSP